MKSKLLGLFAFSIFAFIFLMSFTSATLSFSPTTVTTSKIHGETSATINFDLIAGTGTNYTNLQWSGISTEGTWGTLPTTQISLNEDQTASLTATLSGISANFIGPITGNITVINGTMTATTAILDVTINMTAPSEIQLCNAIGTLEELEIKDIDFTNNGGFGDDDEWFPFEEIEVEIDIKNDGDYDIDDIEVSWGLYDVDADEWIVDFDEEDEFNIKDGDIETFTVSFKLDDDLDVDLEDLSSDTDNYRLYVVADGIIDDSDSSNNGQDTCAFDYKSASIIIEDDFVVLDNIQLPEVAQCGADVQITANAWNIGEDDQEDITIIAYNKELGINEEFIIDDIEAFDKEPMDLTFEIPKDAEEKTYSIKLTIYDEDHDVYENDYDDDRAIFSVFLEVEGNCGAAVGEVSISASLGSEAKAGKDLIVTAIITNNEDELKTFTVSAAGFTQWASSYTVDKTNLILNAGESVNVLFTFDVNKDASGSQAFTIGLISEDNQVTSQPVSVTIEERSGLFGLTGAVTSDNAYLWGIGFLNIILIAIIIIVAVRIARRK